MSYRLTAKFISYSVLKKDFHELCFISEASLSHKS